jgi:hypothetical protein
MTQTRDLRKLIKSLRQQHTNVTQNLSFFVKSSQNWKNHRILPSSGRTLSRSLILTSNMIKIVLVENPIFFLINKQPLSHDIHKV